ncbi:MAG: Holliday junction resolvase RuvX [Alphaproteobacteria bacterium]|nr:Holliday junction resolvase RuvX [Alphaproteobacteria bacterium]
MLHRDLKSFAAVLPAQGRILGLDVGDAGVGIALSDATRTIASPLQKLKRAKFGLFVKELQAVIQKHNAVALVAGYPLNADGTEGSQAQKTRDFAHELSIQTALPCLIWDERLSTSAAMRPLIEGGTGFDTRREARDAMAAAFILQGVLDSGLVRP